MSSEFVIVTTDSFNKSVRRLSKKYRSLPKDLLALKSILLSTPFAGIPLGKNCYKIRLNIASKKTGKSGGARVVTYAKMELKRITLPDIYDKSEKDSISEKELIALLKKAKE